MLVSQDVQDFVGVDGTSRLAVDVICALGTDGSGTTEPFASASSAAIWVKCDISICVRELAVSLDLVPLSVLFRQNQPPKGSNTVADSHDKFSLKNEITC